MAASYTKAEMKRDTPPFQVESSASATRVTKLANGSSASAPLLWTCSRNPIL